MANESTESVRQPTQSGPAEKWWTMFLYMAGDNNLTEEMVWGLQEIKNTLDTSNTIDAKVGVIAQYDASGLNPCVLKLNRNGAGSEDGNLDKKKSKTISSRDLYEKVRNRLQPRHEHSAIAIRLYHANVVNDAAARLGQYGMTADQSKKLVEILMECEDPVRTSLHNRDKEALAGALTIAKNRFQNPVAAAGVSQPLSKLVADLLTCLEGLETDARVTELALAIAQSPDSVIRNTRDLSSPLMIQTFVEDQLALLDQDPSLRAGQCIVVLSGHGGGATGDFLPDEDPQSALTVPKLGRMLGSACQVRSQQTGREFRFPILGLDSCLMSMAEVGYEVRDSVQYLVGSEGYVANAGWPYQRVLEVLADDQKAESAACKIVEKYAAFYQDYEMGGLSTHLAAVDLDKMDNLAAAVKLLADGLIHVLAEIPDNAEANELAPNAAPASDAQKIRNALILAHWYAQSFKFEKYVDLWDFCEQLRRFLPPGESGIAIRQHCEKVQDVIGQAVERSCYCGPDFQHAHGISVFFPWSRKDLSIAYADLRFAQDARWFEFLDIHLKQTQRLKRGHNEMAKPYRLESDFKLTYRAGSPYGTRAGSPYDTRAGSPYDTRAGSPYDTRAGSPYDTRMEGGKLALLANFKNAPDGFFRQDHHPRQDHQWRDRFKDAEGNVIDENGRIITRRTEEQARSC